MKIRSIFPGPGGFVYILFDVPSPLDATTLPGPTWCVIARIARDSTTPECIAGTAAGVFAIARPDSQPQYRMSQYPAVQFDASGGVYYLVPPKPAGTTDLPGGIYRWRGGTTTRLIPAQFPESIQNWVALRNGAVLAGVTASGTTPKTVFVNPQGAQRDLGIVGEPIGEFPDGKAYVSAASTFLGGIPGIFGIKRVDGETGDVEAKWWTVRQGYAGDAGQFFDDPVERVGRPVTTSDGRVFAATPGGVGTTSVTQLYPSVSTVSAGSARAVTALAAAPGAAWAAATDASSSRGWIYLVRPGEPFPDQPVADLGASVPVELQHSAETGTVYWLASGASGGSVGSFTPSAPAGQQVRAWNAGRIADLAIFAP